MSMSTDAPEIGDVALDLAQGRPVHIIADTGQTADDWSEQHNYDLVDNYGNSRFGATADDRIYDVVYCSSAKSEPSKSYAMPESRLLRIETEAADDGPPVIERIQRDLLADIMGLYYGADDADRIDSLAQRARVAGMSDDMVEQAQELADIEHTVAVDD